MKNFHSSQPKIKKDVIVISDDEENKQKCEEGSPIADTCGYPEDEDIHAYFESNTKRLELSKVFENLVCPDWTKVSNKQPYRVQKNLAFLINLGDKDAMMSIRNLESDDNGSYKCMGTRKSTWQTEENLDDFKVQEFKMLSKKKETLTLQISII